MIITRKTLEDNFGACRALADEFERDHPSGLDISPLWGTKDDAQMFWSVVFASEWKRQVGWCIGVGLIPAKIRADLRGADLCGADLRWANLFLAVLSGANLHGANLHGADLRWADLRWADLRGADLSEADLRGADLSEADLSGIVTNEFTRGL